MCMFIQIFVQFISDYTLSVRSFSSHLVTQDENHSEKLRWTIPLNAGPTVRYTNE